MTREDRVASLAPRHGAAILAYFARRVAIDDAADLTSEVLLVAWRRREVIPGAARELPWLYGVARHVLANYRRAAGRRAAATAVLAGELRTAVAAAEPTDDDALDVRRAMDDLPVELREVLQLTYWEGLSSREVAVVLGVSATTVRNRLRQGRALVAASLESPAAAATPATG